MSDIFDLIRLKSCVYFHREFYSPWGMKIGDTGFAQFHIITRGNCVVEVNQKYYECSVGDVLLYPHGQTHALSDQAGRKTLPGSEVMQSFGGSEPCFTNGDTYTRLICGHYEYRSDITHPMIVDLPEFIHLRSLDVPNDERISAILTLVMGELAQPSAGTRAIVESYAQILLSHVLRACKKDQTDRPGFFSALTDERLSKAITRIHRDFATRLGLDELAQEAALSRSAFAQRFKDMAGIAPIEYLAKWRMLNAGELLKDTQLPVAQISEKVGYESDIAFIRAFKREVGVTPSQFRHQE